MILLKLFLSFVKVGLFSFGGGYAAIKLIEEQVVTLNGWIEPGVFADLVTIAEMTPGPIAINAATFVGMRAGGGVPGAVAATLGCIMPSVIIASVLARVYVNLRKNSFMGDVLSCLRPAVVALIASAFMTIFTLAAFGGGGVSLAGADWLRILLFALAFAALRAFKLNPILVMLACGAINLILGALMGRI